MSRVHISSVHCFYCCCFCFSCLLFVCQTRNKSLLLKIIRGNKSYCNKTITKANERNHSRLDSIRLNINYIETLYIYYIINKKSYLTHLVVKEICCSDRFLKQIEFRIWSHDSFNLNDKKIKKI